MKRIIIVFSLIISPILVLSQCLAPSAKSYLDVNNVRARINSGGPSWLNLETNVAQYEIPAGSGVGCFYSGSFWIGAKDPFNVTHVAAVRFRQVGIDFWPGPLSNSGTITPNQCVNNDRIYKLNRWEVEEFLERLGNVGYVIPEDILEWPANGNPFAAANAQAPFKDVNADGIYNPLDGDYPAFAINEPTDRDYHLLGDQCLWWVENDAGNLHTETGGEPLGVELQCMAYAFATCDALNDQTFYRYKVINKSQYNYHDTYIGLWVDADLGFANDDYVQCEVMHNLGFVYNGLAIDGTGGPGQYGAHPPAAGIGILEGPLANAGDGVDNNRDGVIDEPGEHLMMSHFMYHNNTGGGGHPAQNDPSTGSDYYNYMRGIWLDGEPMCYGGTGHPNAGGDVSTPCDFMFPGESDPLGYGTEGVPQPNWTEQTAGNVPFDRRFLLSSGPFDLVTGDTVHMHYGGLWARDTTAVDPFESAEKLFEAKDFCQEKFDSNYEDLDCCSPLAQIAYQTHSTFKFLFSSIKEGTSYHWDFGDGSTWVGRFPLQHTYQDYGTYQVCLTVENDCGSNTACEWITISPPPIGVRLKRIEGSGNMGRTLEFRSGVHDSLFVNTQNRIYHPQYEFNKGPVRIEVLDSTLLPALEMFIALDGVADSSGWKMYPVGGTDTVYSATTIQVGDQQLIPQWGLLVQVKQVSNWDGNCSSVLDCSIEQSNDPWLRWLHDTDYPNYSNWIRSGNVFDGDYIGYNDYGGDIEECFEQVLDGTWAPYRLASYQDSVMSPTWNKFKSLSKLDSLNSVDIVITPNQNKWSRCAVLEIADVHVPAVGNASRFNLRQSPSVDINGNPDGSGTMGMGWFPGYAVNLETGERLNMAFGESSWLQADNGADMIWNPTSSLETAGGEPILGGGHYIYVFGHNGGGVNDGVPIYDEGAFMYSMLSENNFSPGDPLKRRVFKDAMWVGIPMLEPGHQLLESEITIKLRVSKPYADYKCLDQIVNQTHPLYSFNTIALGTDVGDATYSEPMILVYPNPAKDAVTIVNKGAAPIVGLKIYNTNAQLVFAEVQSILQESEVRLDVSTLDTGVYFVVLEGNHSANVKRLIIE